jgi:hypothetical protein
MKAELAALISEVATILALATAPLQKEPSQDKPAKSDSACHGYIAAPAGSETLVSELASGTVEMFKDDNFDDTSAASTGIASGTAAGALTDLPKDLGDSMTSVRWNLPPGVVVVFYEDGTGKGEQLVLWGKGQYSDLQKLDFSDKASRWAWYDIGGSRDASRNSKSQIPPRASEPNSATVSDNAMQFYVDRNFRDDMKQVSSVTGTAAGELQELPSPMRDSLTSMRWNLPEGVIVMLYQDADAGKQQMAIWGQGEMKDLDILDFNDKASRWSWAYVGAPMTEKPAVPPSSSPPRQPKTPPTSPPNSEPPPPPGGSPPSSLPPSRNP